MCKGCSRPRSTLRPQSDRPASAWQPPPGDGGVRWDNGILQLATRRIGRPLYHFQRVASTMPLADTFARHGAPDGAALVAEEQTAGRGRRGRAWSAPRGAAILCSLILRVPLPAARLFYLNAAVSLGLARAVEQQTGLTTLVKWPNDLLIEGRKVAGVLSTTQLRDGTLEFAVCGFGLNVNLRAHELPDTDAEAPPATSLAVELGREVDKVELLRQTLHAVDSAYHLLWHERFDEVFEGWVDRLAGRGERVRVVTSDRQVRRGILAGVDRDGALILRTPVGLERHLVGDLAIGPRPDDPGPAAQVS